MDNLQTKIAKIISKLANYNFTIKIGDVLKELEKENIYLTEEELKTVYEKMTTQIVSLKPITSKEKIEQFAQVCQMYNIDYRHILDVGISASLIHLTYDNKKLYSKCLIFAELIGKYLYEQCTNDSQRLSGIIYLLKPMANSLISIKENLNFVLLKQEEVFETVNTNFFVPKIGSGLLEVLENCCNKYYITDFELLDIGCCWYSVEQAIVYNREEDSIIDMFKIKENAQIAKQILNVLNNYTDNSLEKIITVLLILKVMIVNLLDGCGKSCNNNCDGECNCES